jgi:thiol-disulfide isomerase/thioredoxin
MARLILAAFLLIIEPFAVANPETVNQEAKTQAVAAPQFALKDLKGRVARLADYKGKVLLINFWATWCAPCRAEMPDLAKLQKEYERRGLQIIGIAHPPFKGQTVRRMAKQLKVNYPILLGTPGVSAEYGVSDVLPVTFVVDRDGKIRARILGILEAEEFEQSVEPLLEPEPQVNKDKKPRR